MNALNNNPLLPLPLNFDLSLLTPVAGHAGTFALLQAQTEWIAKVGIVPPIGEITKPPDQP
jgi:hypothetical protein